VRKLQRRPVRIEVVHLIVTCVCGLGDYGGAVPGSLAYCGAALHGRYWRAGTDHAASDAKADTETYTKANAETHSKNNRIADQKSHLQTNG